MAQDEDGGDDGADDEEDEGADEDGGPSDDAAASGAEEVFLRFIITFACKALILKAIITVTSDASVSRQCRFRARN